MLLYHVCFHELCAPSFLRNVNTLDVANCYESEQNHTYQNISTCPFEDN